jgi:hypothetical protein
MCIESFAGGEPHAQVWYKDNKIHRDKKDANGITLPAVIDIGLQIWYKRGKQYRDDDKDKNGCPCYHHLFTIVEENNMFFTIILLKEQIVG